VLLLHRLTKELFILHFTLNEFKIFYLEKSCWTIKNLFPSMDVFSILNRVVSGYTILLLIIGIFSSLLSFYVCSRIKNNPTFIFLSYLSITSIFTLYKFLLTNVSITFFNFDFLNINEIECKISMFLQFVSMEASA
jgi:hypothetical protein